MRASEGYCGEAILFALGWVLIFCATAAGVEFAGGTGEPNDPYQIATVDQLLSLDSVPLLPYKHYVLVASIDLSGVMLTEPPIWVVLGSFDGNDYTVRNLRVEGEGEGGGGLFHVIWEGAEVRNLGVVNAQVVGASGPGALASGNYGTVVNCYCTGAVIGTVGPGAGGLVAMNSGTITNSYSTAAVIGGNMVGGLVGNNMGTVSSCYSTGEVTGGAMVGGLVGMNFREITESYSLATVAGQLNNVGGLVGFNGGQITASYAHATVVGQHWDVGGLVGANASGISSCYASGSVVGADSVGGLAGQNGGRVSASYSVATVAGQGRRVGALVGSSSAELVTSGYFLAPVDGSGLDNDIGVSLTSGQMKQQASFAGFDFWGTAADGASDYWYMPKAAYPVLAWQAGVTGLRAVPDVSGMSFDEAVAALEAAGFVAGEVSYDFHQTIPAGYVIHADPHWIAAAGTTIDLVLSSDGQYDWAENPGDGTADNPYQIQTPGQLESLGDHPELWDRYFVLPADVDMIGRTYPMALIAADADRSRSGFQGASFSGTFDGQGHVIANLTIHPVDVRYDYVGLFGMIAQQGRIEDLKLVDADVEGGSGTSTYVGILAGHNAGTVTNCSATGVIRGGSGDGLVGFNSGALTDCRMDITRV